MGEPPNFADILTTFLLFQAPLLGLEELENMIPALIHHPDMFSSSYMILGKATAGQSRVCILL